MSFGLPYYPSLKSNSIISMVKTFDIIVQYIHFSFKETEIKRKDNKRFPLH